MLAQRANRFVILALTLLVISTCQVTAAPGVRGIPKPLANHPGNVFLAGEEVLVRLPEGGTPSWRLFDYEEKEIAVVRTNGVVVSLGRLPVGFYRLKTPDGKDWISCAVVAGLNSPTPASSPVALDVAMAWFYPKGKMPEAASLCALAGVNRVRDRLSWGEIQPSPGEWAARTRYDESADAQSAAGLQVLQVLHASPPWANPSTKRFPLDLRQAYEFFRGVGMRWRGQVQAFEPWNEADIEVFGGHTGSEMATLQKAAYLGLKAGDPDVTACLNVFATHTRAQLTDLDQNEASGYFDTFNLHHYAPFEDYPRLYADFRALSAGKPLWVTECALPVKWAGDEKLKEPTDADLRVQAERVAKTFACSLHEGANATFYFLLPHYTEGQTQFGLLRPDLTPRPGYVALAAVGRLLADAKPLGQLQGLSDGLQGYVFRAKPDGHSREVMVAWATGEGRDFPLPETTFSVFDHLGRALAATNRIQLTAAPVFVLMPDGSSEKLGLRSPPTLMAPSVRQPSPVVIQALWPANRTVLKASAHRISSEKAESVPMFVYNFSSTTVTGQLEILVPAGWKCGDLGAVTVAPHSRCELALSIDCRGAVSRVVETIRVAGRFGGFGDPVLSMRLMPEPNVMASQAGTGIPEAGTASAWVPTVSGNGSVQLDDKDGAVVVESEPLGSDKWIYPLLKLKGVQRPPDGTSALFCTLTLLEGEGDFRGIFDEENGSSYVVDFLSAPKLGQPVEAVMAFEHAVFGAGWSKPDSNGRLDPERIVSLKIGCNTKSAKVKFSFKNLRWVK
jgi:hypothetical protein